MRKKFKFVSKKRNHINLMGVSDENNLTDISDFLLNIVSNKNLILEGCYGVFEYKEDYIKLNLKKGSMIIYGNNFDISSFENKSIIVKGIIKSIEFLV